MELSQKRFSNRTTFEFKEEALKYTVKDKGGSQSFQVSYGSLPTDTGEVEERNVWYRNVGGLWVLLGLFVMIQRYLDSGAIKGSFWFTLGLVCLLIYWLAKTSYTTINTEKGRLFIIKDKTHDAILHEIFSHRKDQLLSWYGAIDFDNEPSREIRKFEWLLNEGVISESEFKDSLRQINSHHEFAMAAQTMIEDKRTIN